LLLIVFSPEITCYLPNIGIEILPVSSFLFYKIKLQILTLAISLQISPSVNEIAGLQGRIFLFLFNSTYFAIPTVHALYSVAPCSRVIGPVKVEHS